jgi:hypothetical protein
MADNFEEMNLGTEPNDGTGEGLRDALTKVQNNFTKAFNKLVDTLTLAKISDSGDAAAKNVGTGSGDVAAGDAPANAITTHEASHPIPTIRDDRNEAAIGAKGTAFNKNYGSDADTVCEGDDARLSDSREWTADTVSQEEAEAGTSTVRRAWTAERIKQAIEAFVPLAQISISWNNDNSNPAMSHEGSFDECFKKVRLVTLADNGDVNSVLATWDAPEIDGDTDGTDGQVMVELPKLWYKANLDGSGHLEGFELSEVNKVGFTLHPAFAWGDGRDEIYIGAYEAYTNTTPNPDVLCSISDVTPTTDKEMADFRTEAEARGSGWHILGFWEQHLIDMLFYAWYKTRDSQGALPGYTEEDGFTVAKMRNTGRSNILTTINGSVDAALSGADSSLTNLSVGDKIANRFLWIENIFGHIWKVNDGVTYVPTSGVGVSGWTGDFQAVYATADIRDFSSVQAEILADYTKLSVVPYYAGAASENTKNMGDGFVPTEDGGTTSQYWCAHSWSYLNDSSKNYLRVVLAGGSLSLGGRAGVACRSAASALGIVSTAVGARLAFSKI